jgi:hypothetical protein
MIVDQIKGSKTFIARFESREQQCDIALFSRGDQITILNPQSLLPIHQNQVVKTEWAPDNKFRITLENEIPAGYTGYILENQTKVPDLVEIRGNYLGRVPTRSILMYCSKKSIIENNIIHRSPMPAILVKTPDPPYHLQGKVQDLIIRNNVFYECGSQSERAVIAFNLQAKDLNFQMPIYKNIRIIDNLFVRKETDVPLLRARGTGTVLFRGNRIELDSTNQALLSFTSCSDVIIKENLILNHDRPLKIGFADAPLQEIQAIPEIDWVINDQK